jgi:hypothetical protein
MTASSSSRHDFPPMSSEDEKTASRQEKSVEME